MKLSFWGSLFFLCLWAPSQSRASNAIIEGKELQTGSFQRFDASGKKALVLIFLSTECPNSQAHLEEIKKLAQSNLGFLFLGIHSNADESEAVSKTYFKKLNLPFSVLQDDKALLADRFKALKTPHAYVLSSDGRVLYQGGVTDSAKPGSAKSFYLQDALNDIKTGTSVKVPEGRTLGCVIARAKETENVW